MCILRRASRATAVAIVALWTGCGFTQERLYVKGDAAPGGDGLNWPSAFRDLQDALGVARPPDSIVTEIWVAAGVYAPGGVGRDPALSFELVEGVAVLGGFRGDESAREQRDWRLNVTVLSGDLNGDDRPGFGNTADNSATVVVGAVAYPGSELDGFTITGGYNPDPEGYYTGGGGGLGTRYAVNSALVVRNCRFVRNYAYWGGGLARTGVFGGNFLIEDCEFIENAAEFGGGALTLRADGTRFVRCRFENNTATSGGGVWTQSNAVFSDCMFEGNQSSVDGGAAFIERGNTWIRTTLHNNHASGRGGGAFVLQRCSFVNCRFLRNSAEGDGGGLAMDPNGPLSNRLNLQNDIFSANISQGSGGGVAIVGLGGPSQFALANCAVISNESALAAGGIFLSGQYTLVVSNTIVRLNNDPSGVGEAAQLRATGGGSLSVNYCDVEGLTGALGGAGNIDADPRFRDATGIDGMIGTIDDDLRVRSGSPCIDAGSNALVLEDFGDLDGDGVTYNELTPRDLGNYPRFRDDPFTSDSGVGTPPIVDIGAYEFRPIADMNCDGLLNNFDIDPFVLALVDAGAYQVAYPNCDVNNADANSDGVLNNFDIDPFVALLIGG